MTRIIVKRSTLFLYDLPDNISGEKIPSKLSWKNMVKVKIRDLCEAELKIEIKEKYSKLEKIETETEKFKTKS